MHEHAVVFSLMTMGADKAERSARRKRCTCCQSARHVDMRPLLAQGKQAAASICSPPEQPCLDLMTYACSRITSPASHVNTMLPPRLRPDPKMYT